MSDSGKISLKELASSSDWKVYNSKIQPIEFHKFPNRDDRIYLMLVVSDNEGLLFNKAGKRIGTMIGDEVNEFYDDNEQFKIETKVPSYAPDDLSIYGVGHMYNIGRE